MPSHAEMLDEIEILNVVIDYYGCDPSEAGCQHYIEDATQGRTGLDRELAEIEAIVSYFDCDSSRAGCVRAIENHFANR